MKTLKPFQFPDGFVVVVDTREQLSLFEAAEGLIVEKKKLDHGDYSVLGLEDKICIERKRISDLTSYITSDRENTIRKLDAMKDMMWKALVVECEEIELFLPKQFTSVPPEVFRQTLVSWRLRYNLHTYFSGDRRRIEMYVLDHLIKFYKIVREP